MKEVLYKFIKNFRLIIIVILFIILFSIDVYFDEEIQKFLPNFNDSFISSIAQIQATIGTLVFTIVAIVSGYITDTYLGVSITDFYLNIQNKRYTQHKLIKYFVFLTILCVFGYLLRLKLVVLFCFLLTASLIYKSSNNVYRVFGGKYSIQNDIKKYLNDVLKNENNQELIISIFISLKREWSEMLDSLNYSEYIFYKDYFCAFLIKVLTIKPDEAESNINTVNTLCSNLVNQFIYTENNIIKRYGIIFVKQVYKALCCQINNNNKLFSSHTGFTLFANVEFDLSNTLECLVNCNSEESVLDFYDFLNILKVTIITTDKENKNNIFNVLAGIPNYLEHYFIWLSSNYNNAEAKLIKQMYPNIFEEMIDFGQYKDIIDEKIACFFFIYCRFCIDKGYTYSILYTITNQNYNFIEINNKFQLTSLVALAYYVFKNMRYQHENSQKVELKNYIRTILLYVFYNLKENPDHISINTFSLMIRMIENQYMISNDKVMMLRDKEITIFFYFIIKNMEKISSEPDVFMKLEAEFRKFTNISNINIKETFEEISSVFSF